MIAGLDRRDAGSHLADDAGALMAEDRGENPLAVEAVEGIGVGVTNPRCLDFDKDFTGLGTLQIEFDDLKRLLCLETRLRRVSSSWTPVALFNTEKHIFFRAALITTFPHGHLTPVQLVSACLAVSGLSSCLGGRPPGMAPLARARKYT